MKNNGRFSISAEGVFLEAELKHHFHDRILDWVDSTQSVLFFSGRPRYQLRFSLEPSHRVKCRLEVALKFKRWRAEVVGQSPLDAFDRALSSLRLQRGSFKHFRLEVPPSEFTEMRTA